MKKIIVTAIIALSLIACTTKAVFKVSKITPAAEGEVRVKEMKNGNYAITVDIQNLAPAEKLSPSRKYYVVWNKSSEGTFNIGQLAMEEMTGHLESQSIYEPVRIIISAENDLKETKPGKVKVLKSKKL